MTPPIRFLALVVGGWSAVRVIAMMYGDASTTSQGPGPAAATRVFGASAHAAMRAEVAGGVPIATRVARPQDATPRTFIASASDMSVHAISAVVTSKPIPVLRAVPASPRHHAPVDALVDPLPPPDARPLPATYAIPGPIIAPPIVPRGARRLSGSAWILVRGGGAAALASGSGLLGGSQAGARLLYRVNGDASAPVSLSARLSSPLRRSGMEAAFGVEWQPVPDLSVRMLAERRERLGGEGRSAFALLAHGGVSDRPIAMGLTLDAYAQAGVVGVRSRDLFADGGVTLVRPVAAFASDALSIGAGLWGGAQPRAARLDVGPRLTTTLPAGGTRVRLSLDYRFRVAGGAAPASGPSLTIGAGF